MNQFVVNGRNGMAWNRRPVQLLGMSKRAWRGPNQDDLGQKLSTPNDIPMTNICDFNYLLVFDLLVKHGKGKSPIYMICLLNIEMSYWHVWRFYPLYESPSSGVDVVLWSETSNSWRSASNQGVNQDAICLCVTSSLFTFWQTNIAMEAMASIAMIVHQI